MRRLDDQQSTALIVVCGLSGLFLLILVGGRVFDLAHLAWNAWWRVPVLRVRPDIFGAVCIVAGMVVAVAILGLPRAWRGRAWAWLAVAVLAGCALGGNGAVTGGIGVTPAPVSTWLQADGYVRCRGYDRWRRGGHNTHPVTRAEGWALPGYCGAGSPAIGGDR